MREEIEIQIASIVVLHALDHMAWHVNIIRHCRRVTQYVTNSNICGRNIAEARNPTTS